MNPGEKLQGPAPGQVLGERYELLQELAHGGMGRVFSAVDTDLRRKVAIKLIDWPTATSSARARFWQEALVLARVQHPNVLTILDAKPREYEGEPFLVCELLDGATLREKAASPLPLPQVLEYGVQIAEGLAAAHKEGVVHRDLKPENVFVTRDGRVKLIDFGIAKVLSPVETVSSEAPVAPATAEGRVIGTAGYMAPEQIRGERIDPRTDIFAFGALLYELLAGHRAFSGSTEHAVDTAVLEHMPPPLERRVPGAVRRIVERCLAKDPADRFQSALELRDALQSAIAIRRVRLLPWTLGAALLAAVLIAIALRPQRTPSIRTLAIPKVPDADLDRSLDRVFGGLSGVVHVERSGSGDWVLHAAAAGGRATGYFEKADGKRAGDPIDTAAAAFAETARDEFMSLWRDSVRRDRAHRLTSNHTAEEKLLAYYDLMGGSPRIEYLDRGRRLLDEALAADPRYVPALADRSRVFQVAAGRAGADPAEDLRLARADADAALRLSPRDPQALLAACLLGRRQMRDWPSDAELTTATTVCADAAQTDPTSTTALYSLAVLYDKACDDGPMLEALNGAAERAARYDGRSLPGIKFYMASVALQHRRMEAADAASAELLALIAREGHKPLSGAHLMRAAVLLRLGRDAEAEREIETELAADTSAPGLADDVQQAAALRGLKRIHHGALDPARAARLEALERKFAAADERNDLPSPVIGWFGFMDPDGAADWMERHKTQGGCQLDLQRAVIYRDAGRFDRAASALKACDSTETWVKRCIRVISSDLR